MMRAHIESEGFPPSIMRGGAKTVNPLKIREKNVGLGAVRL
jgi:hypothetical protein